EAVLAGSDFDESAEILDAGHPAGVDLADLYAFGDLLDHFARQQGVFQADTGHHDRAVVLDVHGRAGGRLDPADTLAARPDYRADLLRIDLHRDDSRRVRADILTRALQCGEHGPQDRNACLASPGEH